MLPKSKKLIEYLQRKYSKPHALCTVYDIEHIFAFTADVIFEFMKLSDRKFQQAC